MASLGNVLYRLAIISKMYLSSWLWFAYFDKYPVFTFSSCLHVWQSSLGWIQSVIKVLGGGKVKKNNLH